MATEISKVELDVTKEIINIGLSKAADSLSFFIKEKVLIQPVDLKINGSDYNPMSKKSSSEKKYLLTTIIRGEIEGKAYLVFNEKEVAKLLDANLPDAIKNDPVEKNKMTDAILLEVDNIITASVVTQFANLLQCKLYGDVPYLNVLPEHELNPFLGTNNPSHCNVLYFNTHFVTDKMDINPEFIWLMDDKFFDGVKSFVKDEKKVQSLQQLNINA